VRKRFSRLRDGLAKTRRAITEGIRGALGRGAGLDGAALDSIEETLIAADLGVETALHLIAMEIERALQAAEREGVQGEPGAPLVVMVAGVNGVGKTTTIGKLSRLYADDGRSVILAAADTFRAAASEQLSIWADRSGAQFVAGQLGGDAAAVAYDALDAAIARCADVLIVDTAGRLHTQKNLMQELVKVKRVLGKRLASAPDDVLLVIDANTGQNALSQARVFDEALGLTGLVLTKLDGTARGGIVVAIARELAIPVRFMGLGEGIDDIEPFDPAAFARGLLGVDEEPSETA
jgi:fused signal recognition particle receptor